MNSRKHGTYYGWPQYDSPENLAQDWGLMQPLNQASKEMGNTENQGYSQDD